MAGILLQERPEVVIGMRQTSIKKRLEKFYGILTLGD
jgi:hypothetical protein